MIIDVHIHTVPKRGFMRPNGETFATPDEFIEIMDRLGIDKAVALPLVSPEGGHITQTVEDVVEACARYPDRLIPFCNLDPRLESNSDKHDFGALLEYYKGLGCKGVGEMTANLPWDDPRVDNMLKYIEAACLPMLFHVGTRVGGLYGLMDDRGLPRLERALGKFPKLNLLGHSQAFWSEIAPVSDEERGGYPKGPVQDGGRVVELMRRYPNLWGDLSAGSGHNAVSRDPEFGYRFLDEFQDRLLFGTDICSPTTPAPLIGFMREAHEQAKITDEVYEKVMWRNAAGLLGIDS